MKTLSLRSFSREAPNIDIPVLVTHESTIIGTYYPSGTEPITGPEKVSYATAPAGAIVGPKGGLDVNSRPFTPALKPSQQKKAK